LLELPCVELSPGLIGLAWFLRETANQTAKPLLPGPAADELKILPQTRMSLQPAGLKGVHPSFERTAFGSF
jgi:hypothetical protein